MSYTKPVTISPRGGNDALGAFIGKKAEIDERLARWAALSAAPFCCPPTGRFAARFILK